MWENKADSQTKIQTKQCYYRFSFSVNNDNFILSLRALAHYPQSDFDCLIRTFLNTLFISQFFRNILLCHFLVSKHPVNNIRNINILDNNNNTQKSLTIDSRNNKKYTCLTCPLYSCLRFEVSFTPDLLLGVLRIEGEKKESCKSVNQTIFVLSMRLQPFCVFARQLVQIWQ